MDVKEGDLEVCERLREGVRREGWNGVGVRHHGRDVYLWL